jgi:CubicO group peptidase (beta-lactamase class C family)
MNQYNIPGLSIGLIRNDSIIYNKGYGIRDINNNNLVTENTIFHTASISKLFTAVAIMELIAQNRITIEDKLVDLLPKLKYNDKRVSYITIKNLLNHTSGLPDISNYHWDNNNQSDNSLKEFVIGLNLKLDSDPSSKYQYSNLAYDILGYVIEKVTGSTFDDFQKENILNKSGMYNSDFRYFKIHDSLKTTPHSKRWITKNIYERKTYPYTREHAPSSTLNSSSKDLSKWMISFLQTLDDSDLNSKYSTMIEPAFRSSPYIGLGFQLSDINSIKTIGHYGGDKGFRSYLIMIPEEKIGLVVLANCDYDEDFRQEIIHPIAKLMLTKYKKH